MAEPHRPSASDPALPAPGLKPLAGSQTVLSIIIVGWNCAGFVEACLASVFRHPPPVPFEVVYVDNASGDGSADRVRAAFPDVRVITNERNLGFQRANNLALQVARGDFVLLLNPDTEVQPGSLSVMIGFLAEHADVAAVSPRCNYPDGSLQWSAASFPALNDIWAWFCGEHGRLARWLRARPRPRPLPDPSRTQEQDYAYGACCMVRRAAVDQVGLMDERYFLTCGEVAWCREMRKRGWKIYYLADAAILHHESASRKRLAWASELDWMRGHRRLLYRYEGIAAGLGGDALFALHVLAHGWRALSPKQSDRAPAIDTTKTGTK